MRGTTPGLHRGARRALSTALGVAVLAAVPGIAHATTPPAAVTGLSAALGVHGLVLTWTNTGTGTPVVRNVSATSPPYDPSSGTLVTTAPTASCPAASCSYDTAFANTQTVTYAVWSRDADGTLGDVAPITVGPLPPLPTQVALSTSATKVRYGGAMTLTAKATRGGVPFPGAKMRLVVVRAGLSPSTTTLTAAVDGTAQLTFKPLRTTRLQLFFDSDPFSAASQSPQRAVTVLPLVTGSFRPSTVEWRDRALLAGTVTPAQPGRVVTIQRYSGGAWHDVGLRTLSSTSGYAMGVWMPLGTYAFRAVLPGTSLYGTSASSTARLTVIPRTLAQGDSGPDVLAVEKRLAALRYDVGKIDGVFDYDTRHGVTAFEKVELLARNGTWGRAERLRNAHPRGIVPRYTDDRLTAEVDVTRQVLVLVRSGVILKVVDVSTGSEQVYYQDGVRQIAHTPRGVFTIFHKIDGIRISKLGELYKPSYFFKGWAIHGNSSVPTVPASHGCVRITNHVADRLFSTLAIGTRVAVYDE